MHRLAEVVAVIRSVVHRTPFQRCFRERPWQRASRCIRVHVWIYINWKHIREHEIQCTDVSRGGAAVQTDTDVRHTEPVTVRPACGAGRSSSEGRNKPQELEEASTGCGGYYAIPPRFALAVADLHRRRVRVLASQPTKE